MLFKICPLTMRTKAILLVRDAVVILTLRPTEGEHRSIHSTMLAVNQPSCSVTTRGPA